MRVGALPGELDALSKRLGIEAGAQASPSLRAVLVQNILDHVEGVAFGLLDQYTVELGIRLLELWGPGFCHRVIGLILVVQHLLMQISVL